MNDNYSFLIMEHLVIPTHTAQTKDLIVKRGF